MRFTITVTERLSNHVKPAKPDHNRDFTDITAKNVRRGPTLGRTGPQPGDVSDAKKTFTKTRRGITRANLAHWEKKLKAPEPLNAIESNFLLIYLNYVCNERYY